MSAMTGRRWAADAPYLDDARLASHSVNTPRVGRGIVHYRRKARIAQQFNRSGCLIELLLAVHAVKTTRCASLCAGIDIVPPRHRHLDRQNDRQTRCGSFAQGVQGRVQAAGEERFEGVCANLRMHEFRR
jgi:hypothetical protein